MTSEWPKIISSGGNAPLSDLANFETAREDMVMDFVRCFSRKAESIPETKRKDRERELQAGLLLHNFFIYI
jgi:hypothetical protein